MKLVIITGPHAVGKMTVGQALCRITGLKLFHNHMAADLFADLFPDEAVRWQLTELVRTEVFHRFAESDQYGLVFTFMPAYNRPSNLRYLEKVESIFTEHGADVYYVELTADQRVRLERNRSENRLLHKPSKRDVVRSEREMLELERCNRFSSVAGEYQGKNYLRIANDTLSAEEVAERIRARWNL